MNTYIQNVCLYEVYTLQLNINIDNNVDVISLFTKCTCNTKCDLIYSDLIRYTGHGV